MGIIIKFINEIWHISMVMAPSLLGGLLLVGFLHLILPKNFLNKKLSGGGYKDILKVVFFGVPLPLCSCGVIPAAVALDKNGASKGSTAAFLLSTPQTGIDSIFVTASFLGWPMAIFKVIVALLSGFITGILIDFKEKKKDNKYEIKEETVKNKINPIKEIFSYAYFTIFKSIDKWLAIGLIISAIISIFFNKGETLTLFKGSFSYIFMLAISLPLYVCSTGSVPIAAALVKSGMPLGSALIFLIAGPASNIATIGALNKILGKKALIIYLANIIVFTFTSAYFFSYLFNDIKPKIESMHHKEDSLFSSSLGALFLLLLAISIFTPIVKKLYFSITKEDKLKIPIPNLGCDNCAKSLENELKIQFKIMALRRKGNLVEIFGKSLDKEKIINYLKKENYID